MKIFTFCLFVVLGVAIVSAAPADHEIITLPGWQGSLPSKQYSGYLDITKSKHYHYWFVESENEPGKDPIVLWLNGGPGCSSLDGFLYEHGPFRLNDTTSPPTLYKFDYSWAKQANMIYLESPVGVGFSYSDDDADYKCSDDTTANDNMLAMEKFFELFPEYKQQDFYITGESYGGVYVPTLAEAIIKNNDYSGAPLQGIAVGNGCTGYDSGICGDKKTTLDAQFFVQNTAFLSKDLKKELNENCDWEKPTEISEGCDNAMLKMSEQLYLIDLYDVYGECIDGDAGKALGRQYSKAGPARAKHLLGGQWTGNEGPSVCINSIAASDYMNQDDVITAIHVKKQDFRWATCGANSKWMYNRTRPNLPRDTYPLLNDHIRVVIYNGDWDACVPYTDNEMWTSGMGYEVEHDWHPWFYNDKTLNGKNRQQLGGYSTRYNSPHNFTFITIRGGRHEVPETAPKRAFEMLRRLLQGSQF